MRCFQCQRFGHISKICKEKRGCAKCSGDHEYGKCEGAKLKGCSCGGEHVVNFGGCEIMKEEVAVQKVKVLDKGTYAGAVKVVKQRHGAKSQGMVAAWGAEGK